MKADYIVSRNDKMSSTTEGGGAAIKGDIFAASRDLKFETLQVPTSENISVYDVYQASVFMVIGDTWNYVSVCLFCTKMSDKTLLCWTLLTVRCTAELGHNGDINIVRGAATTEGRVKKGQHFVASK